MTAGLGLLRSTCDRSRIHFLRSRGGTVSVLADVEDDGLTGGGEGSRAPRRRDLDVEVVPRPSTSMSSSVVLALPFESFVFLRETRPVTPHKVINRRAYETDVRSLESDAAKEGSASPELVLTISTPLIPPDIGTFSRVLNPLSCPISGPKSNFSPLVSPPSVSLSISRVVLFSCGRDGGENVVEEGVRGTGVARGTVVGVSTNSLRRAITQVSESLPQAQVAKVEYRAWAMSVI